MSRRRAVQARSAERYVVATVPRRRQPAPTTAAATAIAARTGEYFAIRLSVVRGLRTPNGVGSAWEAARVGVPLVLLSLVHFASSVFSNKPNASRKEQTMAKTPKVTGLCSVLSTLWTTGTHALAISLGS